jgi:hypothetical protein
MRPFIRRFLVFATAVIVPLSCPKENPQALLILDAAAMDSQSNCLIRTGGVSSSIRPFGILDLAVTNSYWLFPHFKNLMSPISTVTGESASSGMPETNILTVQGAITYVDPGDLLTGASAANVINKYFFDGVHSYVAMSVPPAGEGIVSVQVIPPELGTQLEKGLQAFAKGHEYPSAWITVFVRLEALTQDKYLVHSNEFAFPILLCWGCLVRYVSNDPNAAPTTSSFPCFVGQDEGFDNTICRFFANHPEICFPAEETE